MTASSQQSPVESDYFPVGRLLLLAAAGFLTMLTETVPAGLLPDMSSGLGTDEALTGQLLTAYAGASMLAAIPLVALTVRMPRKTLILATVLIVALANATSALSPVLWLAFAARLVGGAAAALQWALLAGFAMRMVDPSKQGRALSVAMGGIPIALAIGVPLGTFLGDVFDWRTVFGTIALAGVTLAAIGTRALPAVRADGSVPRAPWKALRLPGILAVLIGAGAFQLGHMNLYTYIAPFLGERGEPLPVSGFLLLLGLAAIAGLFLTGMVIDGHLKTAALSAMAAFCAGMLLLALLGGVSIMVVAVILWGLGLGASPTIFQTACARVAGPQVDQAQSLLVTIFNAGMAAGSGLGGAVLAQTSSTLALPWLSLGVFIAIAVLLLSTARHSLPSEAAALDAG